MSALFLSAVNRSIAAGWIVLAVLALRPFLRRAPKWTRVLLWGIVAARLILPFSPQSAWSLIPSAQTIAPAIALEQSPAVQTGVSVLDQALNPALSRSLAPAPGASANPLQIWIPFLAALWLAGVAALALYSALSYRRLHRQVREAVLLRENLYQCETVSSPFVLGIFRPRIYLPYHLDSRAADSVIAHEQAHIRRLDHLWKPLGFLLVTVYWFNPLLWLSYALLCRDIELACDARVIRPLDPAQRAEYLQALVACSTGRRGISACPLAFSEVGVKARVRSVMNDKKPSRWMIAASVALCCVAAVCFLTNPRSGDLRDRSGIPELLSPGSTWQYQPGGQADFPVEASFTVRDDGSIAGTIVKNGVRTDFCLMYRVRGVAGWAEFYACAPELVGEAASEEHLLFTASLRAENGKLVFGMSDGHGLSYLGMRRVVFVWQTESEPAA